MNAKLLDLIDAFKERKVLVLGEAMLDSYLEGMSDRLCREAPVPVVNVHETISIPGGAANTAVNVRSLGGQPYFLSVVGDDRDGVVLRQCLEDLGVSAEYIFSLPHRRTLSKQRIIAASQILVRFDRGSTENLDARTEQAFIQRLEALFSECDVVIISDYGYGILTPQIIRTLEALQRKDPHLILVDSKRPDIYRSLNIVAIKPNYEEALKLLGLHKADGDGERVRQVEAHGQEILDISGAQIAAVTLDHKGALIFHRGSDTPYRTYAEPEPNSNAAGAGDTFMSVLALSLGSGAQVENAAELASAAASVVVSKNRTATCSAEELCNYFTTGRKFITDVFQLAARVASYRRAGKNIVFTNGCFDILHSGHITYLNRAKTLGDVLIVGLNSDESVRRLKGDRRPINSLDERAQILAALSSIDNIVPFDNDTPIELIRVIRPDVFVKGGDYTLQTLPEAPLVQELGGEVEILSLIENHSTTRIIERIRNLHSG